MQVRHNTALLEQAVDLVVKQAAIPTLQAEAASQEKIARAIAVRRVATGAAIAIAAIGIGIGYYLISSQAQPVSPKLPETVRSEPAPERNANRPAPSASADRPERERRVTAPPAPVPSPRPRPEQTAPQEETPSKPEVITVDFTKFARTETSAFGRQWLLISGHHFQSEQDDTWTNAWCYTQQMVNGVQVNIELANRASPIARPEAPVSTAATLASVGLSDQTATELATKCEWLDGTKFRSLDFTVGAVRSEEMALDTQFQIEDGWDALGNDLPSMPLSNVRYNQCEESCSATAACKAFTYNRRFGACFLKANVGVMVREADAIAGYRRSSESQVVRSNLVFEKDTVVVGDALLSSSLSYPDCVLTCARDGACAGFNYEARNRMCTLISRVTAASAFPGVSSGRKNYW